MGYLYPILRIFSRFILIFSHLPSTRILRMLKLLATCSSSWPLYHHNPEPVCIEILPNSRRHCSKAVLYLLLYLGTFEILSFRNKASLPFHEPTNYIIILHNLHHRYIMTTFFLLQYSYEKKPEKIWSVLARVDPLVSRLYFVIPLITIFFPWVVKSSDCISCLISKKEWSNSQNLDVLLKNTLSPTNASQIYVCFFLGVVFKTFYYFWHPTLPPLPRKLQFVLATGAILFELECNQNTEAFKTFKMVNNLVRKEGFLIENSVLFCVSNVF